MSINHSAVTAAYTPFTAMLNDTGAAATPDATPMSTDALLMLFSQASGSNATVETGVKTQIEQMINGKQCISSVEGKLGALNFDQNDNKAADATAVKTELQTQIAACKDPQTKANLTAAYNNFFNDPGNTNTQDNLLSTDEVTALRSTLDNATSGIDDNMQMATLNLKSSEDKFSQITNLIKDIMDSNNKVFTTINQQSA